MLLQFINTSQYPLQISMRRPGLKLRLHMPTQKCLGPHKPPLKMINSHRTLRIFKAFGIRIVHERLSIPKIQKRNHSRCTWFFLETQLLSYELNRQRNNRINCWIRTGIRVQVSENRLQCRFYLVAYQAIGSYSRWNRLLLLRLGSITHSPLVYN